MANLNRIKVVLVEKGKTGKWIMTARQYVLNIYTENHAYARPFKTDFG